LLLVLDNDAEYARKPERLRHRIESRLEDAAMHDASASMFDLIAAPARSGPVRPSRDHAV